jgi:hypothetical protein
VAGFASPDRLRPQVFSTSRRVHPLRACWPCFMPDPLMGLRPSELCSSRAAVRRLRRLYPLDVRQPTMTAPTDRARRPKPTSAGGVPRRARRPKPPNKPEPVERQQQPKPPKPDDRMERPRERSRLQGVAPRESPPLQTDGLGRPGRVALLDFRPPGCSPSLERHGLHRVSPHGLGIHGRYRPRTPPHRVSIPTRWAGLSRDCRPSWALAPCDHVGR